MITPDTGRDFKALLALVERVRAGGRRQPATEDVLSALVAMRTLRDEMASWEPDLVAAARQQGVTWEALAPALGVASRQAAERRFLRVQHSSATDETAEDRVRATRARRAGDRAVVGWARENASALRELAGQVGAAGDLPLAGRRQAARVRTALADDDASTLLDPLTKARTHLEAGHADLAERIRLVTERMGIVRRTADPESG